MDIISSYDLVMNIVFDNFYFFCVRISATRND
nr:MAG TPA: hypothetical protein [Caudoviricetes sp.]